MANNSLRQTEAASSELPARSISSLDKLWMTLGIAITLYILVSTLIVIRNCYSPIPHSDQWDEWRLFLPSQSYRPFLFDQHNEHRIVLARLFFYIDQFVFHARNTFLLVSISLIQAITGMCIWRFTLSAGKFSRTSSVLLGCFIFSCLFSAQQFENLTWGFQVQFVAVYCAANAALFALARAARQNPDGWVAAACFFAVLSTYSMSNGLLIWPLLLLMSFWLRLPIRYRMVLGAGMVVMSTAYLWRYYNPGLHANPVDSLTHRLPRVLTFAATFLGSPADSPASVLLRRLGIEGDAAHVGCSAVCGLVGILVSLGCLAVLWRKRRTVLPAHIALFCVLLFLMATSFVVALGRVNFPLAAALVSRYATPALIFWAALVSLVWSLFGPEYLESRLRPPYLVHALVLLAMLGGIAAGQPQWIKYSKDYAANVGEFEAVVVAGVDDPEVLRRSYHTPDALFPVFEYLKNNRLGVFTEDWTHWPGTPLAPHFVVDTNPKSCVGNFDDATFIPSALKPGSRVSGWAWDQKEARAPQIVILADHSGRIVGVVHNLDPRDDVAVARHFPRSAKVGWRGYISATQANPVTAYLLESDGKSLCAVGARAGGYRIQQAAFTDLSAPIESTVGIEGTWTTQNGYHHDAGRPPFDGPIYGSWAGNDANTGTLRLGPFHITNQVAIAIPLVSGPSNDGLLLKVVNTQTGELIGTLAPPPIRTAWWAWRVDLPVAQPDLTLNIIAEDMGHNWGQWLAIGLPHLLKNSTLNPLATVNRSAQEIPFSTVGAAVEGSPPSIEGFWKTDGYYPDVGRPPIDGPVYGSWAGSDAHTGTIRLGPFPIRGQSSMALPLLTGPRNNGMEVKIFDSVSGEILALLSPPPVREKWWAWKVNLPKRSDLKVVVVAQDDGAAWGQWQAVGVPHLLK